MSALFVGQSMLHEEQVPPAMTMVLAMGPKLLVKSAVERNLAIKARQEYTSGEVAQLCADAVHVIKRSGLEYEEASRVAVVEALSRAYSGSSGARWRRRDGNPP